MADRPERMPTGKRRQQSELVARTRIVFHRAGTKRIELRVDRKILLRQAREMPYGL